MKSRPKKKEIVVFYIYYRGRGRAVGDGARTRVRETGKSMGNVVGGVKEDTWACVRMGSGGGGSIVRTTAGTRKKKVEKIEKKGRKNASGVACGERAERMGMR